MMLCRTRVLDRRSDYVWVVGMLLVSLCVECVNAARANVTLRMGLSHDIDPECDETVYKVVVCAGEFTNECQIFGPVARYLQASCASQGPPEPLSFSVNSVEHPIELDVSVQRVGETTVQRLRRTEFRLTEDSEISVTSFDLTLIVRFLANYVCLPNYFGKLCDKFCDQKALEYSCDDWGNLICRPGYYRDTKTGACLQDKCANTPNYCKHGGTCVTNPDPSAKSPVCLCPVEYFGPQCEFEHMRTHSAILTTTTDASEGRSLRTAKADVKPLPSIPQNPLVIRQPTATNSTSKTADRNEPSGSKRERATDTLGKQRLNPTQQYDGKSQVPVKSANWNNLSARTGVNSNVAEINQFVENEKVERPFKRTVPLIIVTLLVISLLIVCMGFIVWILVQRRNPKYGKTSKTLTPNTLNLSEPPKRWASVDQSPTKMFAPANSFYCSKPPYLSSFNGTLCTSLNERPDADLTGGSILNASFHPSSPLSGVEPLSTCGSMNTGLWMGAYDHYSSLPRRVSTISHRRTADLSSFCSPGCLYASMVSPDMVSQPYTNDFVDPYMHASTTTSPVACNTPHSSVYPFQLNLNGMEGICESLVTRTPSVPNACYHNSLQSMPQTPAIIYGSVAPVINYKPRETKTFVDIPIRVPGEGVPIGLNKTSVAPALIPPPPTSFADSYISSVC